MKDKVKKECYQSLDELKVSTPPVTCGVERSRRDRMSEALMKPLLLLGIQVDLRIMCENAMIYNKPETIYHKAARKLLHSGMKILSQV